MSPQDMGTESNRERPSSGKVVRGRLAEMILEMGRNQWVSVLRAPERSSMWLRWKLGGTGVLCRGEDKGRGAPLRRAIRSGGPSRSPGTGEGSGHTEWLRMVRSGWMEALRLDCVSGLGE